MYRNHIIEDDDDGDRGQTSLQSDSKFYT